MTHVRAEALEAPELGLILRTRFKSATVYCRGSGRVRFPRGSLRRPPGADGCLEVLCGHHWAAPIFQAATMYRIAKD
jgi:hypothetical protein